MNFSGEIDELRKKRRRDEAEAGQKIGERKNFLGEPARTIGVDPDARKRVRKAEDELKEAQMNLRIKLDAYIAKSDTFLAAQREVACKLQNPAEMAVVKINNKKFRNCFDVLQHDHVRLIVQNLIGMPATAGNASDESAANLNMVVELRRALTFVDKNTALEALRAVWGVLGSALASRDLSTIVVSRGCICVAVDEKGDTIALYRINSEKVAVYNVDEDRIVRELESCVSQGRGHVFRDVGTMAFVGGIEYYVVNLTRFSARVGSATVSKKRISNQMICHGNVRETVRINRFSEGVANPPFFARPPTLVPVGTSAEPFYIKGVVGKNETGDYVTVQVDAVGSSTRQSQYGPNSFYTPDDQPRQVSKKYPSVLQEQIGEMSPAVESVKFYKMGQAAVAGPVRINAVARIGPFLFVQPNTRNDPIAVAIMPNDRGIWFGFAAQSIQVYMDGSGTYVALPGSCDGGEATVIAKLYETVRIGGKRFAAAHVLRSLLELVNAEVAGGGSPHEKRRRMGMHAKRALMTLDSRPHPLVVRGLLVAVTSGRRACIQFGGTLIRINDAVAPVVPNL